MKLNFKHCGFLSTLGLLLSQPFPVVAQSFSEFASGLQYPLRGTFTSQGNLLVSEGGVADPNTGRISVLNRSGARRSLIEGLPSGPAHGGIPYGPTSTAVDGNTLYILFGEGVYSGTPPNLIINPNGPVSPILSSVLKIRFSADIDRLTGTFRMSESDHWALLDGYDVALSDSGEQATVQLLTSLRPLVRNVLGGASLTRQSDPYGAFLDSANTTLYFTDSGTETIHRVNTNTGKTQTIMRFTPFARQVPAVASVDNVPTGICRVDDRLYVATLTAAPFPENEATIQALDTGTGIAQSMVRNLTAVVDLICGKTSEGAAQFITLERFSSTGANLSRVRIHEGSTSRIVADGLPISSGAARDPITGDVFVMSLLDGRVLRVPVQ